MIVSKKDPEKVLAQADPVFDKDGVMINVQDAYEALAQGDGRELFVLNFDLTIELYLDEKCMGTLDGKVEKMTEVVKSGCKAASKWVINRNHVAEEYVIYLEDDNDMVLSAVDSEPMDNAALQGSASASSSAEDPVHTADKAAGGGEEGWISSPGEKTVTYKVDFPWYTTICSIDITWLYFPKKFQISLLKN